MSKKISPETHKWAKRHRWELLPDGESVRVWVHRKKTGQVIPFLFDLDFLETYTKGMSARWHGGWRCQVSPDGGYLHQLIAQTPKGMVTDHIDGDTQDNRKKNLRVATVAENNMNSKKQINNRIGYKGVYLIPSKKLNPFRSRIQYNKKKINIGYYITAEEAARAYDKKALELFGEFACLNFPEEHQRGAV